MIYITFNDKKTTGLGILARLDKLLQLAGVEPGVIEAASQDGEAEFGHPINPLVSSTSKLQVST